jgi:predicted nucleotidyltransferase
MGLLRLLQENKDARKVFGKRELKIIEKQMLGVSLTQSEKNRLSRDIRKKLEFIAAIAVFKDEFDLKKGSEIKSMVDEAKETILADAGSSKIENIILYGSAAENSLSLQSDIDLAVKFSSISLSDATLFRKRVLGKVNKRMDVQVYNSLPAKVRKEIDVKGKTIHERKDKR